MQNMEIVTQNFLHLKWVTKFSTRFGKRAVSFMLTGSLLRIIEKTDPVRFVLKHQLDGTIVNKMHAQDIRKAPVDDWEFHHFKVTCCEKQIMWCRLKTMNLSEISSDDEKAPLARIAQRYRRQRHYSDSEEDIPLMELTKRLKASTCQTSDDESDQSSQMSDRENNQGMSDNWDSESYKEIGEESMSTDLM